jgi:predicted RNase H-like HicB family nuclease
VNPIHNEFTAIIERDGGWFIAYCPEIPGANGQGKTKDECLYNLSQAIDLILEDRREDAMRGIPADASREMVSVPRHTEISDRLALKICSNLSIPAPK